MNNLFITVIPLVGLFFNLFVLVYVFAQHRSNRINRAYLLQTTIFALWCLFDFIFRVPRFFDNEVAALVMKGGSILWLLTGVLYLNLVYAFLGLHRKRIFSLLVIPAVVFFILTVATDLVIAGVRPGSHGYRSVKGVLYVYCLLLAIVLPLVFSLVLKLSELRKTRDPLRQRITRLMLSGLTVTLLVGLCFELAQWFSANEMARVPISVIATVQNGILFFVVIKYRFLSVDIENVAELLFFNMRDAVIILDHNDRIIDLNPAAEREFSLEVGAYGLPVTRLLPRYNLFSHRNNFDMPMRIGNQEAVFSVTQWEVEFLKKKKFKFLTLRDITRRKNLEKELMFNAFHDSLTGLPNRAFFMDKLNQGIARLKADKRYRFAILFLDLDRFKLINDTLGHLNGDQLLRIIAGRLQNNMRPQDLVARLGGDEFTVLVENYRSQGQVVRRIKKLQKALAKPIELGDHEVSITTSIGIALSSSGYDSGSEMLRDADTALYRAKAQGRDQYTLFNDSMRQQLVTALKLESDLRKAMQGGELFLVYLPVYDLKKRQLVGFEALLRWNHKEHGVIYPLDFIEIAEDAGLITELGYWVFDQVCLALANRAGKANFFVSVNISRQQFLSRRFVNRLQAIVQRHSIDPGLLSLEVGEKIIMPDEKFSIGLLTELRNAGFHIKLDNFGTGYSALNSLSRFPLDYLKIDKSYIDQLLENEKGRAIVAAVITMAQSLDLRVIAEGVEKLEQARALAEINCDLVEGYLLGKPMAFKEAEELFDKGVEAIMKDI